MAPACNISRLGGRAPAIRGGQQGRAAGPGTQHAPRKCNHHHPCGMADNSMCALTQANPPQKKKHCLSARIIALHLSTRVCVSSLMLCGHQGAAQPGAGKSMSGHVACVPVVLQPEPDSLCKQLPAQSQASGAPPCARVLLRLGLVCCLSSP